MKKSLIIFFAFMLLFLGSLSADIYFEIINSLYSIIFRILEIISATIAGVSITISIIVNRNKMSIYGNSTVSGNITTISLQGSSTIRDISIGSTSDVKNELISVKNSLEFFKQENVEKICDLVIKKIKDDSVLNPLDKDFVLKYLNDASSISDSDIQEIWAEILAKKVTSNISISKRMLDIVKTLSSDEAKLFSEVASFADSTGTIYEIFKKRFSFMELSLLVDIGLIKSHDLLTSTFTISPLDNKAIIAYNKNYLLCGVSSNKTSNEKFSFKCASLTNEGVQLKQILDLLYSNKNLIELRDFCRKECKNNNITFSIHKIISLEGTSVEFEDDEINDIGEE